MAEISETVAAEKAGDHYPPLSGRENPVGAGAICAITAALALPAGGSGCLSTLFVEVRNGYDGSDHL